MGNVGLSRLLDNYLATKQHKREEEKSCTDSESTLLNYKGGLEKGSDSEHRSAGRMAEKT